MGIAITTRKGAKTIRATGKDAQVLFDAMVKTVDKPVEPKAKNDEAIDRAAQAAYEAYCMHAAKIDEEGLACHAYHWSELDAGGRECWRSVATKLLGAAGGGTQS
ncbi:MAG: hypothetical protein FD135_3632 [Comamonadaceae bacterium]|nr:MAG: hypothetical protein FD135_3632 [Comamonadaceae bacterium]